MYYVLSVKLIRANMMIDFPYSDIILFYFICYIIISLTRKYVYCFIVFLLNHFKINKCPL